MIWKEKHKQAACLIAVIGSVAVAAAHATQFIKKQRIYTSVLTGQKWLDELLAGEWQWFFPILLQFDFPTSDQDTQHTSVNNLGWNSLCFANCSKYSNIRWGCKIQNMSWLKSSLPFSYESLTWEWVMQRCKNASRAVGTLFPSKVNLSCLIPTKLMIEIKSIPPHSWHGCLQRILWILCHPSFPTWNSSWNPQWGKILSMVWGLSWCNWWLLAWCICCHRRYVQILQLKRMYINQPPCCLLLQSSFLLHSLWLGRKCCWWMCLWWYLKEQLSYTTWEILPWWCWPPIVWWASCTISRCVIPPEGKGTEWPQVISAPQIAVLFIISFFCFTSECYWTHLWNLQTAL